MNNHSPLKAILVVLVVVVVCSALVSTAVVTLRPIQRNQLLLEQGRKVIQLSGLLPEDTDFTGSEVTAALRSLDERIVDLDTASFATAFDPASFDQRRAAKDPHLSVAIPPEYDRARLGRRSRYVPAWLVWKGGTLNRIILPVHGQGMWSTLYGYIALESDLNTIADALFYEQNETAGLGDQITHPEWLAKWRGRKIYNPEGELRFAVAGGKVTRGSLAELYSVDALSGATVTADAVTDLVNYWFGPHGYRDFLERLRRQPPDRAASGEESG